MFSWTHLMCARYILTSIIKYFYNIFSVHLLKSRYCRTPDRCGQNHLPAPASTYARCSSHNTCTVKTPIMKWYERHDLSIMRCLNDLYGRHPFYQRTCISLNFDWIILAFQWISLKVMQYISVETLSRLAWSKLLTIKCMYIRLILIR